MEKGESNQENRIHDMSIMLVLTMVVRITASLRRRAADGQNVSAGADRRRPVRPAGIRIRPEEGHRQAVPVVMRGRPAGSGITSDEAGTGTAEDQPISRSKPAAEK